MKKISLFIVLFCVSLMSMAQDVIVKKDGSTIQSKVMEINGTEIKYKKWSNQEGPMYSINRSEVLSINYQNGDVERITSPKRYHMERNGIDLTLNGRTVYGEEVKWLVGNHNYQTYLSARKQIATGKVFTFVFIVSLGSTIGCIIAREQEAAIVSGVIADVSLPLMCIFKGIGKGRLNWIADEYNRNERAGALSYQLYPSIMKCNSMVQRNNLGIGLTLSVNL